MSGIATAVIGGAVIGGATSLISGKKSAEAIEEATDTETEYKMEALDYLKEVEAVPRELREGALGQLGTIFGLDDDEEGRQAFFDSLSESPLYSAIMGSKASGEEAIMRQAGATGGLRSGNVQEAMYDYNVQLENEALLEAYKDQVSGLSGLAGLPSYASEIAGITTGIGETQSSGLVAAAQAEQAGYGQAASIGMTGLSNLALLNASSSSVVPKNLTTVSI